MTFKLLVVQAAALGYDLLTNTLGSPGWRGLKFQPAQSIFPALTCPVQATMRTALLPDEHGMTFNGYYSQPLRRPMFWEQSARLVSGPRIWEQARRNGLRTGMLFWQQSLGEEVDMLLSPAPIHKHGGGMIDTLYSKPAELYPQMITDLKKRFRLMSYWGPLAGSASTRWITRATARVLLSANPPDLLFTYLPHLDYTLQRNPPQSSAAKRACRQFLTMLGLVLDAARASGHEVLVYGDYAIGAAAQPLFPNKLLRDRNLMAVRRVGKQAYPDFHESRAFAVADHEVAHVFLRDPSDRGRVEETLRALPGTVDVIASASRTANELVMCGRNGAWFAYPWWEDPKEAPDFAGHIDIHNKPGYDPCELFWGWPPPRISSNPRRIAGTHGRIGPDRSVAWASTLPVTPAPANLLEIARWLKNRLLDLTR